MIAHFVTTALSSSYVLNSFSRCSTDFWISPHSIILSAVIFHESGSSISLSSSRITLYFSYQRSIAFEISCSWVHLSGCMIAARLMLRPWSVVLVNHECTLKYAQSPSPWLQLSSFSSASPSALALRIAHMSMLRIRRSSDMS